MATLRLRLIYNYPPFYRFCIKLLQHFKAGVSGVVSRLRSDKSRDFVLGALIQLYASTNLSRANGNMLSIEG